MIFMLLVVALVTVWVVAKRRRLGVLAGRDSARPVYSIEPPARRLRAARKDVL